MFHENAIPSMNFRGYVFIQYCICSANTNFNIKFLTKQPSCYCLKCIIVMVFNNICLTINFSEIFLWVDRFITFLEICSLTTIQLCLTFQKSFLECFDLQFCPPENLAQIFRKCIQFRKTFTYLKYFAGGKVIN
jgi:hypothetical protein